MPRNERERLHPTPRILRLATRGSPLALWQATRVGDLLSELQDGPLTEPLIVHTTGDDQLDVSLDRLGGQGVFVNEVQAAVLDGRADAAVHSAKDLPSSTPSGLVLASVPLRDDPRDAMVGMRLADLEAGATVATGSVRRRSQLAWLRPDLTFCDLRGNIARRVERATTVGAGIAAVAALGRLGMAGSIAEVIDPAVMLPQAGQGALAVECGTGDDELIGWLARIDDELAHLALLAERSFLATLGGGCTLPVAALATVTPTTLGGPKSAAMPGGERVFLQGLIASRDGRVLLRRQASGDDPGEVGHRLAIELVEQSGGRLLDDWEDWDHDLRVPSDPQLPTGQPEASEMPRPAERGQLR